MAYRISCYRDVLPITAIVAAQFASVGLSTIFKAASSKGLNFSVFTLYMNAVSSLVLLPFAFFFGRKTKLPSSGFGLFWRICLLGILCVSADMIGLMGIQFSSPTLDSAANNLTPAFVFIFAIIFRMEKLAVRSSSFQAKLTGTIVSVSGALLVVFYKGPVILQIPSLKPSNSPLLHLESSQSNWVIGGLLLLFKCLLHPVNCILMTDVMRIYPSELVVSLFQSLCVTILSLPICFISDRNPSAWIPTSNTAILALIYSSFFGPAFLSVINSWSLRLKGPVYVALFNPLGIVIAVFMGVTFLGDSLHLGSVIGALILLIGVYAGIWGKAKEDKMARECCKGKDNTIPLLQSEEVQTT